MKGRNSMQIEKPCKRPYTGCSKCKKIKGALSKELDREVAAIDKELGAYAFSVLYPNTRVCSECNLPTRANTKNKYGICKHKPPKRPYGLAFTFAGYSARHPVQCLHWALSEECGKFILVEYDMPSIIPDDYLAYDC